MDFGSNASSGGGPAGRAGDGAAPNRAMLAGAIAQLTVDQREILRRAYFYRWSTERIAADLGITECSVKTHLHRGLRAVYAALQAMGAGL